MAAKLEEELQGLAFEVQVFQENLQALYDASTRLQDFNQGFGRMERATRFMGMALEPKAVLSERNVLEQEKPELKKEEDKEKKESPPVIEESRKVQRKQAPKKSKQWDLVLKKVGKDLPKRYLTRKEDLKRMETVWRTVASKKNGAILSDIVRVCGCSVLQANECLGTLVKTQVITRKKDLSGLRYFATPMP